MAPHEERVVDEKAALDKKIVDLRTFLRGLQLGVDDVGRDILRKQLEIMDKYSAILGERINRF